MDGDSFFASVEQALDWRLRGKPVITGAERGAATALSYEAKKTGARRGMTLREIKKLCPDAIVVPSNYTAYSIYAHRMYKIVRGFTPEVEEYSIDECFAEITGLDKSYGKTYEEIGQMIKDQLEQDLGITFGVGLAPNKTLAKIASSKNKPAGFTPLPTSAIPEFLKDLPMGAVWGVGFSTSMQLERVGVRTALDFAQKDRAWLKERNVSLPYQKIWAELNGGFARNLGEDGDERIGSIIKSHTFKPTRDRAYILSQLSSNLEAACAKARRHHVKARLCRFYLKTQAFTYTGLNLDLTVPLADPREFLRAIEARFDDIHEPNELYRATGIGLYALTRDDSITPDIFGTTARVEKEAPIISAMDRMNHKYGRHTIFLGESFGAVTEGGHREQRFVLPIHQRKKTISIPHLGSVH
jgi:nucleotidyltransferase/DNA polymerase involved in DNA repair